MRLLAITSSIGAVTNVRPEAEIFIGLKRAGVDVTVMTEADTVYIEPMRRAGIRLIDFAPQRKWSVEAIRRIRAELKDGYDAVYAFNNKAIANTVLAAIGLPVKVITYRGQTGNISRWDPTAYLTHLNPRVDAIFCVAEAVRQSLLSEVRDPSKVVTIYKGHELSWYDVTAADLTTVGLPADAFCVVCVSNYRPRKGIDVLVDSAAFLPEAIDVQYLLIGSGMDGPELAERIARSPRADRFHTLGFRHDSLALVAAAQVSVLPAIKREGLPKTVIEAMACRVPPIVTDTGGNAELVQDGESGIVVPPGDARAIARAITRLHDAPDLRARMGEAARARIGASFRVDDTVAKTLATLESLIKTGRVPGP